MKAHSSKEEAVFNKSRRKGGPDLSGDTERQTVEKNVLYAA